VNILQRKMFANGDVATTKQSILPLYEKHAKQLSDSKKGIKNEYGGSGVIVEERGQDPIFDSFLDRYGITPEQYSQIHQQAGNRVIYDPGLKMSAPLLEMAGGKGILQGIGSMLFKKGAKETGEFIGRQANLDSKLNPIKGKFGGTYPQYGDDILTPVTKEGYQLTNPGRFTAGAVSLPLVSGSAVLPKDKTIIEAPLIALDQTQVELNKIAEEQSAAKKTKAEQEKANKLKTKQEIENINKVLEDLNIKENKEKESFIKKREERKNRNTGIFLNEMAKAFAGTDNLADGIAIGAANSSDAVMKADDAEELSYAAFKKEEEEKNAPPELKESDIRGIADIYSEAAESLGKSTALKQELGNLVNVLQTGNATGATGFVARLADKVQGFFGADGEIRDATAAKNLSLFLEVRLVEAVLDEKGKTISDADRALIAEIIGNLESPLSNKASVINLLGIVNKTLDKKIADASKKIEYHKTRYGTRIPELSIFDLAEGISETKTQGPAAKEYSLDPTLIKPIG
jgi:hypothetical protein